MTRVTVRFAGGLELLVGGRKRVDVHLPPPSAKAAAGAAPPSTPSPTGGDSGNCPPPPPSTEPPPPPLATAAPPPPPPPATPLVGDLIAHVRAEVITERHDAFATAADAGVRPGILVLINDVDWELEGTTAAALADGDVVSFISTLHGG